MNCTVEIYYCLENHKITASDFLLKYLHQEEIDRAAKFVFPKDQQLYIVSHAFLNNKLSEKMGINPTELIFKFNEYGKPFICKPNLFFNLSHSKDSWCMAFSTNCELGIDIEEITEKKDFDDILPLFFTIKEQNKILESSNTVDEFYRMWTRKEAVIKALGVGLNCKLNEIDVCENRVKEFPGSKNAFTFYIKSLKKHSSYISLAASPAEPEISLTEVTGSNFFDFFSD